MNLAMNSGTQLAPVTASVFHTKPNVRKKEESTVCVCVCGGGGGKYISITVASQKLTELSALI